MHDEDSEEELNEVELDRILKAGSDESLAALLAGELHETKKILLETLIFCSRVEKKN